ncbi:MAG: esterase-like activity of phytase family protein [Kastovskya adunca ATA6-11-RM4]|jgi:hypothetical protein|nr:esterase-like activity of phytase family protein [Kastovskya adunca ATA6-11-RM4]
MWVNENKFKLRSWLLVGVFACLSLFTTSCGIQPGVAQDRLFLDLSLDYLGEYQLPKLTFKDTPVGGISALTYDRSRDRLYALSDDRSERAPARFYTIQLTTAGNEAGEIAPEDVIVEDVTFLKDENGETYAKGSLDPEGIALSPKESVFISSEGIPSQGISPFIQEFDLKTGQQLQSLPIPERFLPGDEQGVQENLGFESLTLDPTGLAAASGDPFRLFTATESALVQDKLTDAPEESVRLRLLHYILGDIAPPLLVAEHLYLLAPTPAGAIDNGLTELVALDPGGHFLSLERTYGLAGAGAKIYQVTAAASTDTSTITSFNGDISGIRPIQKKLLLDLSDLGIYLDNLEAMTLGPRLADGSQSLVLVSDDNFSERQLTQLLLFRLKGLS